MKVREVTKGDIVTETRKIDENLNEATVALNFMDGQVFRGDPCKLSKESIKSALRYALDHYSDLIVELNAEVRDTLGDSKHQIDDVEVRSDSCIDGDMQELDRVSWQSWRSGGNGKLCSYGRSCKKADCPYDHSDGRDIDEQPEGAVCRFGWGCKRQSCFYSHPNGRRLDTNPEKGMCRLGEYCAFAQCVFSHPPQRSLGLAANRQRPIDTKPTLQIQTRIL